MLAFFSKTIQSHWNRLDAKWRGPPEKKSQAAKNAVSNRDVTPNLQDFFLSSRPYAGHFCLTAHISRALKCFAAHSQNGLPLVFWCLLSVLFIIIWCIYVQKLSDETVPHYFFEFSVLLLLPTDKSFAVSFLQSVAQSRLSGMMG